MTQLMNIPAGYRRATGRLTWNDLDVPDWAEVLLEHVNGQMRVFAEGHFDRAVAWPGPGRDGESSFYLIADQWRLLSLHERGTDNESQS